MFNEQGENIELEKMLTTKVQTEGRMLEKLEKTVRDGTFSKKIDEELRKINEERKKKKEEAKK